MEQDAMIHFVLPLGVSPKHELGLCATPIVLQTVFEVRQTSRLRSFVSNWLPFHPGSCCNHCSYHLLPYGGTSQSALLRAFASGLIQCI